MLNNISVEKIRNIGGDKLSMNNGNENENKPFNDAIAHKQKIEGFPKTRGGRLPLPIKLIGYLLFGSLLLMLLVGLVGNFLFD